MRVLVGCEYSGVVRDAFARRGHDAWSCDILPSEAPGNHIQGDVLEVLGDGWDLGIFHPPCTRITNAGVRWLHERNLWDDLDAACKFFRRLLNAPIPRRAIENPRPHYHAVQRIGRNYNQCVQPWMFGHGEQKPICLWLENLAELIPTNEVAGREQRIWKMSPGPNRSKERSRFYPGVADAMAEQWGGTA